MSVFQGFATVREAATQLRRSQSQVTRYVAQGMLRAVRQDGRIFIPVEDLKKFLPPPKGNPAWRKKRQRLLTRQEKNGNGKEQ